MKQTIFYADAHAGSGKTYSALQFIKDFDGLATIATQTDALSLQQCVDLAEIGIKSHHISLKTTKNCTKQYARHCDDARKGVAVINQNVAKIPLKEAAGRQLIIDEIFSPVEKFKLVEEIPSWHQTTSQLFRTAKQSRFPGYYELLVNDAITEIAELSGSHESSLPEHIREVCKRTNSPHYLVLVAAKNYDDYQANVKNDHETADEKESKCRLIVYAWIQPSIFKHLELPPVIMGANYLFSKLALYWHDKVDFVPHDQIKGIRYSDFSHKSHLITFRHLSDDHMSMYSLEKIGYQKCADSLAETVEAAYPGKDYIVTLSAKKPFQWNGRKGEHISPACLGLNSFQHLNMAVHFAPLNPSKDDLAIWEAVCGVTEHQLMTAQAYEMQYQFTTRTSVRDNKRDSTEELVFILPDLPSADRLRGVFGVEKPSELLEVPALTDYTKPARKTRSDKKCDAVKKQAKTEAQRLRRLAKKARQAAELNAPA